MKAATEKIKIKRGCQLQIETRQIDDHLAVFLSLKDKKKCILHWGVCRRRDEPWRLPPQSIWPAESRATGQDAVDTPFKLQDDQNLMTLTVNHERDFSFITFVLFFPEENYWDNNHGRNYFVRLPEAGESPLSPPSRPLAEEIKEADEIIRMETGRNSWTLMHRFNLCHDMLDKIGNDLQGLALLFVWLRFSAIRQLDWQRNYNTKPRELTHAQQRLTLRLSETYGNSAPAGREIVRLIFSTLGRGAEGGKGQRIRDDILHIMHRHRIKEVTGHFMEEWHQKLHNNATPDDIVICEAYLAFLRSNGDLDTFYKTLEDGGVTKKRLQNFERPIVTDPDFNPHIKDGLIHDFENYLKLLKSVHSATDLRSAMEAAGHCLEGQLNDHVWSLYNNRDDASIQVVDRVQAITEVRRSLNGLLDNGLSGRNIRDILYLDLALEEFLRVVVERNVHKHLPREPLVKLIGLMIENVRFSHDNSEFAVSSRQWQRLQQTGDLDKEWFLHARSILDRVSRALGSFIDSFYGLLQPKAEHLGNAFHAEQWTIDLFSQEVVRAGSPFVLSILLRLIDPILRKGAELGEWQVISQAEAAGTVEVSRLLSVQDKKFKQATVIVTDKVTGDEVIPEGVTAVVTPNGVDILSHLSIRARNAGILFATCYDSGIIETLKSHMGENVRLTVNSAGGVEFQKTERLTTTKAAAEKPGKLPTMSRPVEGNEYSIASQNFSENVVGGKSNQLLSLKGKLPSWIHLPGSVAVPFGVCEKILGDKRNEQAGKQYEKLADQVDKNPHEILPQLQKTVMALAPPAALLTSLREVMTAEGLGWPENDKILWQRIKHVWASKWNERAYRSRKIWGIPHDTLYMAVLIQKVVNAEYAFVIHTANPFTTDKDELYAEIVHGLGETLCSGNYPGRALSFTCRKEKDLTPRLVSYPSKSVALKGAGFIFRSDSNGEDLEEYAGAGLYESVLLEPPVEEIVDYTDSRLLWDEKFRNDLLKDITKIGIEIEKALNGCPQDIEGAYVDGKYYVVQTRTQVGIGQQVRQGTKHA